MLKTFGSKYNMKNLDEDSRENASRLAFIEGLLDELASRQIRKMLAGDPFTIGIILSYFLLVKKEAAKIDRILDAKYYELPEERIRALL
jgi:vacuolar-type H+-ATPase subunit C/Vma6